MCTENQLNIILKEVAETAKNTFKDKFDSAFLYGSYARGDFDNESDVDIIVIADIDKKELVKYKEPFLRLTSGLGLKYDILITVNLDDLKTFKEYCEVLPFYQSVLKEGVKIA